MLILVMDGDGEWVEKDGRGVLEAQAAFDGNVSRLAVVPLNVKLHWDTLSAAAHLWVITGQPNRPRTHSLRRGPATLPGSACNRTRRGEGRD